MVFSDLTTSGRNGKLLAVDGLTDSQNQSAMATINDIDFVDGPIRQKGFESFVGVDPLPILHGLTVGELHG